MFFFLGGGGVGINNLLILAVPFFGLVQLSYFFGARAKDPLIFKYPPPGPNKCSRCLFKTPLSLIFGSLEMALNSWDPYFLDKKKHIEVYVLIAYFFICSKGMTYSIFLSNTNGLSFLIQNIRNYTLYTASSTIPSSPARPSRTPSRSQDRLQSQDKNIRTCTNMNSFVLKHNSFMYAHLP